MRGKGGKKERTKMNPAPVKVKLWVLLRGTGEEEAEER